MRAICITALGLVLALPAAAQTEDLRPLARQYIALPALQHTIDTVVIPDPLALAIQVMGQFIPQDKQARVREIFAEELRLMRSVIETQIVEAFAVTYTRAEIEALIAFNSTPEGLSVARKNLQLADAYRSGLGPVLVRVAQAAAKKAKEELNLP